MAKPACSLVVLVLLCTWLPSSPAVAQGADRAAIDARIDQMLTERWKAALDAEAKASGLTLVDQRLSGSADDKRKVYTAVLDRLKDDGDILVNFTQAYVQSLIDEKVESRMGTSVNATSTNPATAGLPERSGAPSLAALAADVSSLVSADKTAVTVNLNALAFVSLREPDLYSELAAYQSHELARRFSGSVTFGARIPEKEITGLSNLPDFDQVLDAFSWDAKVRVLGDKDPRASRWNDFTVVRGGFLAQKAALLLSLVGVTPRPGETAAQAQEDALIVRSLLEPDLHKSISAIKSGIARSPQLSIKAAGTHLTKETGKNKYAFTALFDAGLGRSDVTANVQYSITDDVRLGIDQVFQVKAWALSGEVISHLAPDAIVEGRTLDWSLGGGATLFQDTSSLPVPADNTWKLFSRLDIPVRGGGRVPISIIYTNDPNALTKEKYVTGQIGLSYDFSALKELFVPGS